MVMNIPIAIMMIMRAATMMGLMMALAAKVMMRVIGEGYVSDGEGLVENEQVMSED